MQGSKSLQLSRNYLDKTTLSYSSVMGITEDLNLQGDNYQWLGSIFYFGYLVRRPATWVSQFIMGLCDNGIVYIIHTNLCCS